MDENRELLDCVEIEPPGPCDASVLWLHGLGADGHDFPPIVPELGLPPEHGVRFVFPHAPVRAVTINAGMRMRAWYDIVDLDSDDRGDEAGVRDSAEHVAALVARETERGVRVGRIVLAGFSQGGAVALHLGLRHPERLAGILALSTYIACDCDLDAERHPANHATPIFQAHGTLDPMVPHHRGVAARDRLRGLGYAVEWHEYPMAHQVCLEEIQAVGTWLRGRLG